MGWPFKGTINVIDIETEIKTPALILFLQQNYIPITIANQFLVELNCERDGKKFKGLGCPNPTGNYEIIGPNENGKTGSLQYTLWENNGREVNLFNNQLDFLTCQKDNLHIFGDHNDSLIVPGLNEFERAITVLDRYDKVNCYFNHTVKGRLLTERALAAFGDKTDDLSDQYKKDLSYHQERVRASKEFDQFINKRRAKRRRKGL